MTCAVAGSDSVYLLEARAKHRQPQRDFMGRPGSLVVIFVDDRQRRVALAQAIIVFLCFFGCGKSHAPEEKSRVDKIVIVKADHTLSLMSGESVIRTYQVALGRNPIGPKTRQGDHRTPEGLYVVDAKKSQSRFHLALHLSYPNEADRERAQKENVNPGSDVEIHGIENGLGWIGSLHRHADWTDGCIAVTDSEIEEIWTAVAVGTPVEIRP
jgi:murein L,D-transpeptidase YafK